MKHTYRFGWPYFSTRQIRFVKTATGEGGITHMKGVIRDSHQTWDVQDLYPLFLRAQKATHVVSTQPTPSSETQNPETSSEVDAGTSRTAAQGTGE